MSKHTCRFYGHQIPLEDLCTKSPQTQTLNLGAWKRTEVITECYRDIDELLVIGWVIRGDDATDDH
jgi:hypothetical protein